MQGHSLQPLQARISAKLNGTSRRQVTDKAQEFLDPEAPTLAESALLDLQKRLRTPPGDGRSFRAFLAALDIPLVVALSDIGYWPDLSLEAPPALQSRRPIDELVRFAAQGGIRVSVVDIQGNRAVITLDMHERR